MKKKLLIFSVIFLGFSGVSRAAVDLKSVFEDLQTRSESSEKFQKNKTYVRIKANSIFQNLGKEKLEEADVSPLISIFYIDSFRRVVFNDHPEQIISQWSNIESALEKNNFTRREFRTEHAKLLGSLFSQIPVAQRYEVVDKLYNELIKVKYAQPLSSIFERACSTYYSFLTMNKALSCAKFFIEKNKLASNRVNLATYALIAFYENLDFKNYDEYIKKSTVPNAPNRATNQAFQVANLEFLRGKTAEALKATEEVLTTTFPKSEEVDKLLFTSQVTKATLQIYNNSFPQALESSAIAKQSPEIKDVSGLYRYSLMMAYYYIKTKSYPMAESTLRAYLKVDPLPNSVRDEVRIYGLLCALELKNKRVGEDCLKTAKKYRGLERIPGLGVSVAFTAEVLARLENPGRKFSPGILPELNKRPDLELFKLVYGLLQ